MVNDPCPEVPPTAALSLPEHEKRSKMRFDALAEGHHQLHADLTGLREKVDETINATQTSAAYKSHETASKEYHMGEAQDIKINLSDLGALGGRGGGSDNSGIMAALMAQMGNKTMDPSLIALLNQRGGSDGGLGGNGIWPILLLALLRGGGLFGENGAGRAAGLTDAQVMATLGDIKAAIPSAAQAIELAISQQTLALGSQISSVKDAVQNNALAAAVAFGNSNALTAAGFAAAQLQNAQSTQAIIAAVNTQGDLTRALINQNELADLRTQLDNTRREVDVQRQSINVTQTVNQAQAQAQAQFQVQTQHNELTGLLRSFAGQLNTVHQGIVQVGAGNAAVPTSTLTNVR